MEISSPRERGSALVAIRKYVQGRFNKAWEEDLLSNVPYEVADSYRHSLSQEWLPTSYSRLLLENIYRMTNADKNVIKEIGAAQARNDVKGILRFLVVLTTPHQLIKRASRVWSQYVNVGSLSYEKLAYKSCEIIRKDYNNGELDCLMTAGFIRELAGFTGARNVEVEETECVNRKGKECRWKVSWD